MTFQNENKTAKALREAQQALVWAQNKEARLTISLNAIESMFLGWKHKSHSALLWHRKREYANNARLMYKEWQQVWGEIVEVKARIIELTKNIKKYEIKIAKTKEYNERRRKRRTEKKQVSQ
jgi:hypothetical protein